jgi:glycosyltransferase involved in cell wall biosynthesis
MKKTIVVSAVALYEGGSLTVLKECLNNLSEFLSDRYRVIALVHDAARLPDVKNIEYREYKTARKNWLFRLYYEYVHFFFVSRRLKPYLWLSLHDTTPHVAAEIRAVYCQNPSPFYPFSFRVLTISPTVALFSLFYKYLYRINIRKNDYVIVQQEWIRKEFRRMYRIENIIVAHPVGQGASEIRTSAERSPRTVFLYPVLPRVYKNIELIAEAANMLCTRGRRDFSVLVTINGRENAYARRIVSRYSGIPTVSFIGLQSEKEIQRLYGLADVLVFSSKLETWGLPISEFKVFNKPMLLPDVPYAHEALGDYEKVKFYDPDVPQQLADYMQKFMDGSLVYDGNESFDIEKPFARNWEELFSILLNGGGRPIREYLA